MFSTSPVPLPLEPLQIGGTYYLDREDIDRYGIVGEGSEFNFPEMIFQFEQTLQTKKRYFEDAERLRMVETALWRVKPLYPFKVGYNNILSGELAKAHGIDQIGVCRSTCPIFKELLFKVTSAAESGFLHVTALNEKELQLDDFGLQINERTQIDQRIHDSLHLEYFEKGEFAIGRAKSSYKTFTGMEFKVNLLKKAEGIYFITPMLKR